MWLKYNDNYDISDTGLVRNSKTGKFLKTAIREGYHRLIIREDKKPINKTLSIMVAERFLPRVVNPELTVDHIDRDKNNNCASNLRWASRSLQGLNRTMGLGASGLRHINFRTDNGKPRVNVVREGKLVFNKTSFIHYFRNMFFFHPH
jgi:hypothetical protein